MLLVLSPPVLSQSLVFPTSDSSFQHYFLNAYFPFINWVHLCFPVCLSSYQTAFLASPRINCCNAVPLIYRPLSHSWPIVLCPTPLCPASSSFLHLTNPLAVCVSSPPTTSRFLDTSHQQAEEWLERSSDFYCKLNLSQTLAPSKVFFLFALMQSKATRQNSAPEGRCQRHPKENKTLHSRDMALSTRQAGAQFSVLKLSPVSFLELFR